MRATTAAAYLDEVSVDSFRRRVGSMYPRPVKIRGRGELWLREDLDKTIDQLSARVDRIRDAADVL
jgi:Arc/MetJ family transcription regulator